MMRPALVKLYTKPPGCGRKPAMEAMAKLSKQRLQEFNTAGQASKIKKVLTTAEMAKRYVKGELDPKVA